MTSPEPDRRSRPPGLLVFLLGRFAVVRGTAEIPAGAWRRRRAADLLRLLALAPGHALHRELAIDCLWPDKDLEDGANNLHRALYDLRKVLGEDWVTLEQGVLRLSGQAWVDVESFETAAASDNPAGLALAFELYHGELCPEEPHSADLAARREALRQRFLDVAFKLARRALTEGAPVAAVDVLRRLVAVDPGQEEAHRLLMRALAESGRPADAERQFTACREALAQLGTEPEAATRELARAIAAGEVAPQRRAQGGWRRVARRLAGAGELRPLRGREDAVAEIVEFVETEGGVLLIIGESGMGKTRLAIKAARLVEESGGCLFSAVGLDLVGLPPCAPFREAWDDYLACAGLPVADSPFPRASLEAVAGADRLRLMQAVLRSLERLATGRPVCLVLDDLHFLDEASLDLFHYLAHASRSRPVNLIATCRSEDMRSRSKLATLLRALRHERIARRIEIGPLGEAATREQMADILGHPPRPEQFTAVWRLTAGNPLYTEEVVATLLEGGSLEAGLPEELAGAIRERVSALGEEVERLLLAASVLGGRFRFEVAQRAAGLGSGTALTALERTLAAGLLEEDRSALRFRAELVREALQRTLCRTRRAALERAVTTALGTEDPSGRERLAAAVFAGHRSGESTVRAVPHLLAASAEPATESTISFLRRGRSAIRAGETTAEATPPPDSSRSGE